MPSVTFFRSFYALRSTAPGERSGCVSFRIADGMGGVYIPMSWDDDKAVTRVTKKVDDFRQRWFIVDAKTQNHFFDVPEAPPLKNSNWSSAIFQSPKMADLVARMKLVREAGLTGQMVAEAPHRSSPEAHEASVDVLWPGRPDAAALQLPHA
jgi:hypothetical protein